MSKHPTGDMLSILADQPGTMVGAVTVATDIRVDLVRNGLRRLCELGLARATIRDDAVLTYRMVENGISIADVIRAEARVDQVARGKEAA